MAQGASVIVEKKQEAPAEGVRGFGCDVLLRVDVAGCRTVCIPLECTYVWIEQLTQVHKAVTCVPTTVQAVYLLIGHGVYEDIMSTASRISSYGGNREPHIVMTHLYAKVAEYHQKLEGVLLQYVPVTQHTSENR